MLTKTAWKEFMDSGDTYRIRATYGFDEDFAKKTKQQPYFTITGDIQRYIPNRYTEGRVFRGDTCGCIHAEIAFRFPELSHLIKWHLVALPCMPLHYKANALYWLEMHLGCSKWKNDSGADPLRAFKNTIVYGAVPSDEIGFQEMLSSAVATGNLKAALYSWLDSRLPELTKVFHSEMKAANLIE